MAILERDRDTIAAVSTAPGMGGIAVVRISGRDALTLTRRLSPFLPETPETHKIYFGSLVDEQGLVIDECLVSYFGQGRSFTGEETLEISCHGSPVITKNILLELVKVGARLAERGEFTYRAFMGGRLDLVQAESVLQLIESQSDAAARLALRQLKGGVSSILAEIENDLILVQAHLEANIDFAQEDIEISGSNELATRVRGVLSKVDQLKASYQRGRAMHEGLVIALVGPPNVGKSSLLNALLGEDRAIVTDVPGTTRDLIECDCSVDGVRLRFVDTAGLRETNEQIERMGIARTEKILREVDFVAVMADSPQSWLEVRNQVALRAIPTNQVLMILNKSDLWDLEGLFKLQEWHSELTSMAEGEEGLPPLEHCFALSAQSLQGVESLKTFLAQSLKASLEDASPAISNVRHFELLGQISASLGRGLGLLQSEASPEFVAFELMESIRFVHELLGKRFDDQVMDRVFKEFCLGK